MTTPASTKIEIPAGEKAAKKKTGVSDFDAMIAADLEEAQAAIEVAGEIILFGREWRLIDPGNGYNLMRMSTGDGTALLDVMIDMVHPEERADFEKAFRSAPVMPPKVVISLFTAMSEKVTARPTKQPSRSRTGRTTPRSSRS